MTTFTRTLVTIAVTMLSPYCSAPPLFFFAKISTPAPHCSTPSAHTPIPFQEGQPSPGFSCPVKSPEGRNYSPEGWGKELRESRVQRLAAKRLSALLRDPTGTMDTIWPLPLKDGHPCQCFMPPHELRFPWTETDRPPPGLGSPAGQPCSCLYARTRVGSLGHRCHAVAHSQPCLLYVFLLCSPHRE